MNHRNKILSVALSLVFAPSIFAEEVTIHAAESGKISGGGSCCSPYEYDDAITSSLGVHGCHDGGVYGCITRRLSAAWRWETLDLIPDGAVVESAQLVFRHTYTCSTSYSYVRIGVTSGALDSDQLQSMDALQVISSSYTSMILTIDLELEVLENAMAEGSIFARVSDGELQGCGFVNSGVHAPRLVVNYEIPLPDCPGDLNGDRVVDGTDISMILGYWGHSDSAYDVDGDGLVDGVDLSIVLGEWGDCPEGE